VFFIQVPPPGARGIDTDAADGAPSSRGKSADKLTIHGQIANGGLTSGSKSIPPPTYNGVLDPTSTPLPSSPSVSSTPFGTPGASEHKTGLKRTTWSPSSSIVFQQLCALNFLTDTPGVRNLRHTITGDYFEVDSDLVRNFEEFPPRFMLFVQRTLHRYLINASIVLNSSHVRCLNLFILSAFDMARDMLITPKKIEFAREKEEDLYKSLMQLTVAKLDEIRMLISGTIQENTEFLINKAANYDFIGMYYVLISE
jgi:hypothetical protein